MRQRPICDEQIVAWINTDVLLSVFVFTAYGPAHPFSNYAGIPPSRQNSAESILLSARDTAGLEGCSEGMAGPCG